MMIPMMRLPLSGVCYESTDHSRVRQTFLSASSAPTTNLVQRTPHGQQFHCGQPNPSAHGAERHFGHRAQDTATRPPNQA